MKTKLKRAFLFVVALCLLTSAASAAQKPLPTCAPEIEVLPPDAFDLDAKNFADLFEGIDVWDDEDYDPVYDEMPGAEEVDSDSVEERDLEQIDKISFHLKNGQVIDFQLPVNLMREFSIWDLFAFADKETLENGSLIVIYDQSSTSFD